MSIQIEHNLIVNDPTNSALHGLHLPGYKVADATARAAITTQLAGEFCFQEDTKQYFFWSGVGWINFNVSTATVVLITGNYNCAGLEAGIVADATSTNIAITLPVAPVAGQIVFVTKSDSTANYVQISPYGTTTINYGNGSGNITLKFFTAYVSLQYDGVSNWNIVHLNYDNFFADAANLASGVYAHAEGQGTTATGSGSHAEGQGADATGINAHAEGRDTTASGTYSHVEGLTSTASGSGAHAEGQGTTASGTYSHAEGSGNTASGIQSHAEGSSSTANNYASHAEGISTTASGQSSHTEGNSTTASGENSHAEGIANTASGDNSHVEGQGSLASGVASHAEGGGCQATASYAHAEGGGSQATANYAHAEGSGSTASGTISHAEGNSTASGDKSHAEGDNCLASGNKSHAGGNTSTASGEGAFAQGHTAQATHNYSTVLCDNNGASSSKINELTLSYDNGCRLITGQATTNGDAGTAVSSQPFQGSTYKKFVVNLSGFTSVAGIVIPFPTAFSNTPFMYGDAAATAIAVVTTTTISLTTAGVISGNIIIEGF